MIPPSILEQDAPGHGIQTGEVIRANKFELVDLEGNIRAVIELARHGEPRLVFADRAGQIQAMLGVEAVSRFRGGAPTLRLFDKAGTNGIDISLTRLGDPVILLRNKKGGHLALLTGQGSADGGTEWALGDEDGHDRVILNINHAGTNLIFLDKEGKVRANFGLKPDGTPGLVFSDEMGKERAVLGYTETKKARTGSTEKGPLSSLTLFDQDGNVIWNAP